MSAEPEPMLDRALLHVATAVAANAAPADVFALVADAVRTLLAVDSAGVVRYEGPTHGRVMGQSGVTMPNRRFTLLGENTASVTARTGRASHVADFAVLDGDVPRRLVAMGQRCGLAVPVHVDGRLWGALVAGDHRPGHIAPEAADRLEEFAGLIALMLAAADARTRLEQLASTDPLTGLINHRAFQERLTPEQVSWVRSHHERPDGRGYPDGLTADAIPDGAAVLGVADAYDAMTVARPYSAPLLPAEALDECRRLAGAQFDPDAVAALEAVLALPAPRRYPSRWGASGS